MGFRQPSPVALGAYLGGGAGLCPGPGLPAARPPARPPGPRPRPRRPVGRRGRPCGRGVGAGGAGASHRSYKQVAAAQSACISAHGEMFALSQRFLEIQKP